MIRRFSTIICDTLLITSVLFVTTLPVLTMTGGEAVPASHRLFRGYLSLVGAAYFIAPWMRSGQTLGMLVCRIKVYKPNGEMLRIGDEFVRWLLALLSWLVLRLGFLAALLDTHKRTLHDRWSGTILVMVPKV